MKRKKGDIIYYSDELNDDFGEIGLKRPDVPENYQYIRKGKIYNFFSNILYYGVAYPVLSIVCLIFGVKIKNKGNLKKVLNSGGFIYQNHTSFVDMFQNQVKVVGIKRRTNIIGYSDTLTIPFVGSISRSLGYIPLPNDLKGQLKFMEALKHYIDKKQFIIIFPEAHIWPYYTKIRPFVSASFHYPAKFNAPVIPVTTVYRKGRFKNSKPRPTLIIGEPIYPKEELSIKENKEYLRNECYKEMVEASQSIKQYEYFKYVKKEKESI